MLGWIFKKPVIKGLELPQAPSRAPAGSGQIHVGQACQRVAQRRGCSGFGRAACGLSKWSTGLPGCKPRLATTRRLLAVAESAAPLEIKLAAVEALSGEASLKLAERRLRNQERRVHRLAKQRLGDIELAGARRPRKRPCCWTARTPCWPKSRCR
jgi:hypothetical protein